MKNIGIALVVVGLVIVIWGFFGYKTQDKVVDIGPIHATKETKHDIPYGPVTGALIVIGGVVLIGTGSRS